MATTPLPNNQENRLADSSLPAVQLQTLNEIIRIATSTLGITEVFEQVGEQVKKLIPWDWLNIALHPPGEDYYEVFAFSQAVPAPQSINPGMHIPLDQGPPGEVIRTGRPIVRRYAPEESTYPTEVAVVKEAGFRSLMFVPLESKGRVIGTLNFYSYQSGKYSEEELNTAQAIADHLSEVVEPTLLYEALRESEERYRSLYSNTPVMMHSIDGEGRLVSVNNYWLEVLGYQRNEVMGLRSADFLTEASRRYAIEVALPELFKAGSVKDVEFQMVKKNGEVMDVLISAIVERDQEGEIIKTLAFIVDVTERKQAQEMLFQQMRELTVLEERNRLAREIHDTLAQGLIGIIWQLNSMERAPQRSQESALESVERVRNLARECLDEARRSVWDLQASGTPITLTESIQREVTRTIEQGIRTSMELEGEEPDAMDRQCELTVLRIAQEALSNVRRHSRAKRVIVDLTYGPTKVRLQVFDDGVGFDPTIRRAEALPTGGGFGMTSMRERVRLVGGRVEVRSAPGMGTRVEVEIPYQLPAEEAPIPATTTTTADYFQNRVAQGIRVLVVDDHEVVRKGIYGMLERTEDMVILGEAGDGESAIEQIQELEPDVVLMDIQMPKLDGVEAVRKMRELGLNTPVILLSVYAKDEYIFEGLRAGARGYLLKDVDRDELVQAVRSVHAGGSLFQPLIASRLVQRSSGEEAVGLTEREIEVLRALGVGGRDKEIADQLFLSVSTVRFHITNIYRKLAVQSRTEAVRVATERGLLNT